VRTAAFRWAMVLGVTSLGFVLLLVEDVRQDDLRVRGVGDVRGRGCESIRQVFVPAVRGENDRLYAHTRTKGPSDNNASESLLSI
jgi:hypothetical protein